jgi:hypothetical protein
MDITDADGTFLMGSGLTTNTVPRWNGSALGNSSIWIMVQEMFTLK